MSTLPLFREARHDGRKGGKWGRAAKTAVFPVERRHRMENPLLTQAAALLTSVVRQHVALPCSLEQLEATIHPLAHALARRTAQQLAVESVAQAEGAPLSCACGGQPQAQQRRSRRVLLLFGLVTLRLRRDRCPTCGAWQCPGAIVLRLRPRQRLTRTVEEWLGHLGLAWSFVV